jgi:hypothetical protein
MRALGWFVVLSAYLAGSAAQDTCGAGLKFPAGLRGCAILAGAPTPAIAARVNDLPYMFDEVMRMDEKYADDVVRGLFSNVTTCRPMWDVQACWFAVETSTGGYKLCDSAARDLLLCEGAVEAWARCKAGGSLTSRNAWTYYMEDLVSKSKVRLGAGECFGDLGWKGMNASRPVQATTQTTAQTTAQTTTTPVATTRGASSTGALPFATTPAPKVVASSAGRATAAGWALVVGCGWCSFCKWCKDLK